MNFALDEIDVSGKEADRLARQIFVKIADGSYSEGRQLPSVRELAGKTSLTDYSARKVVSSLAKAGLVEVVSRKGMYVAAGAKKRAVGILKKYDYAFNSIGDEPKKTTIAIAAAFKKTIDGPQIYHPQTVSGIYSEAATLGFEVELINFNIDIADPQAIVQVVRGNNYSGVIWLYPEEKHWQSIDALVEKDIAVVVGSKMLFDTSLPCVQMNGYGSTLSLFKYLINVEKCDVINWFSTEIYDNAEKYKKGNYSDVAISEGYVLLNMAIEVAGFSRDKLNIIEYDGCRVSTERILKKLLDDKHQKNGIVLANTPEFRDFLKRYPENYDKAQNHCFVLGSTINQLCHLSAIAERLRGKLHVILVPFEDVGRALATKISGVLAGRFVENTTLVNTTFSTYSEILEKQNNSEFEDDSYIPASSSHEQAGLLLTV